MEQLVDKVSEKSLAEIVEKAKDWALLHGFTMRSLGSSPDQVEFVPFTLLPSSFPRAYYDEARAVQPLVSELMLRVSLDAAFLRSCLEPAARVDEFTRRLLELHQAVDEAPAQSLSLGLLRSDYMLDERTSGTNGSRLKQVEINTIASGQGWLGSTCSSLHRYVIEELSLRDCIGGLVDNDPLDGLCRGMLDAWKLYGEPSSAILFVVEDSPRHIADQRFHEYRLRELEPGARVLRLTLAQLGERAALLPAENRLLLLVDSREVGLVYLRSGYSPEQYGGESEWRARLLIERSAAVKCPSIGYQLAGTKKVQQVLARPGCLERFIGDRGAALLRRHFAGLYSLDFDEAGEDALESALARPEDFVLKPQREGGSNNCFGDELSEKLASLRQSSERSAWILMDRIRPLTRRNYIVSPAGGRSARLRDVNSELGVFGVVLADGDRIIVNTTVGHTLRTKIAEYDEGGVSSGHGACDSPFFI